MVNVLSAFDGIACGLEALKRAGIEVTNYFASEVDEYAIKVAMKNHPEIIQLGDVKNWREWDLPEIDLVIGGSPCQGFSYAGKQLNFDDPRSRLFFDFVDIINHFKTKYFLSENVLMKKEWEDVMSQQLGVMPIMINSTLVSAQNRKRLYWTNIPNVGQPEDKGILLKDILENGVVDRDKSYCIDANYFKGGNLKSYYEKGRRQLVFVERGFDYRKLTPIECERLQTLPDNYTEGVSNTQRYKMLGNGWTVDVISHIFKNIGQEDENKWI